MDSLITTTTEFYVLVQYLLTSEGVVDHRNLAAYTASLDAGKNTLSFLPMSRHKNAKLDFKLIQNEDQILLENEGTLYRIYWSREDYKMDLNEVSMLSPDIHWLFFYGPDK